MQRLAWGLIGGGQGSQIGPLHRIAAAVDGRFVLAAGALDADPERGRDFAISLGIDEDRAYGNWREMLERESARQDRVDLVTVATPNALHCEITTAFLDAGFHVLCEKPMTMDLAEADAVVDAAARSEALCAVNYGYTGYPLVRQMRAMVRKGDLGAVRVIVAEFAHGFHADAAEADNPRIRWRYDPALAGQSAVFSDAGIHALHMACFVAGQNPVRLSADLVTAVAGRELEDDAAITLRLEDGATCRLWTSAVAVGRVHGLTLQVFGEKGGMRWEQERPNQLHWTPLNGRTQVIERGDPDLYPEAEQASRITIGHAEGLPAAFANLYRDLAEVIQARRDGREPSPGTLDLIPGVIDGHVSVAAVEAAVESARGGGRWVDVARPHHNAVGVQGRT